MKAKKERSENFSDAIDDLIEEKSMLFEENLKMVIGDLRKEIGIDLRHAGRKLAELEKRITGRPWTKKE